MRDLYRWTRWKISALSLDDPKAWDASLWRLRGSQSLSGETVNEDTALTYSAIYNAVSLIAGTVSTLPLKLIKRRDRSTIPADNESLYHVMHTKANPYMTALALREAMMGHLLLWGNAYIEVVRNKLGDVIQLWPITPNRVKIKMTDGELFYHIRMEKGQETILSRNQILHIPGLGFDGLQGYSVVAMARRSIGLGMAMETFGSLFFGQGTHPGVVVTHPGKLSEPGHKNLKQSLADTHSGLGQSHRLMLLEEGMKLDKIGIEPEHAQFLESRQFQIPEIARWFNLPPHKLKDLTKSSFCLPADVDVFTQNGPVPIADIKAGEQVWSLARNGFKLSRVMKSGMSAIDAILTIKTTNRTLRCNAKHPILCRVKDGDRWETKWVQAGRLNRGDTIITLQILPKCNIVKKRPNGKDITIPFMEFCGLLIGDGNIINQNDNPSYVTIAGSDRATYINYYRTIAKELFTVGGYVYRIGSKHPMAQLNEDQVNEIRRRGKMILTNMDIARKYKANICAIQNIIHRIYDYNHPCAGLNKKQVEEIKRLLKKRETTASIARDYGVSRDLIVKILSGRLWRGKQKTTLIKPIYIQDSYNRTKFNSHIAARELLDLGFGGKARTKQIPAWMFALSDDLKLAFLRGFLDSDGSVDKKGRISFSSCNKRLLSQIRHLCMSLGIPVTNVRLREGTTSLPNGKLKKFSQYYMTCSDPGQNIRIGSHTPEYMHRLENGKPFCKKDRNYPEFGGNGFVPEGCSLARVVSIEKDIIHQPVYDLAVNETQSFIANGIVVHNSNIESEQISFVTDSILPWLIRLEQNYNMQLLTDIQRKTEKLYFKHSVEGLLRGNAKDRGEFYRTLWNIGAISINEVREKEDMDPIEGGDEYFIPLNMIPLSHMSADVEARLIKLSHRNLLEERDSDETKLIKLLLGGKRKN